MITMSQLHRAIRLLNPLIVTINDYIAYDKDGNIVEYDRVAAEAEAAKETQ
jgi:hypothetical protein